MFFDGCGFCLSSIFHLVDHCFSYPWFSWCYFHLVNIIIWDIHQSLFHRSSNIFYAANKLMYFTESLSRQFFHSTILIFVFKFNFSFLFLGFLKSNLTLLAPLLQDNYGVNLCRNLEVSSRLLYHPWSVPLQKCNRFDSFSGVLGYSMSRTSFVVS